MIKNSLKPVIHFHDRFDVAQRKSAGKIYDQRDEVDRLSYVDSVTMINRFISEGRNLNAFRANVMRSGMYENDEIDQVNDGVYLPVYPPDITIAQAAAESMQKRMSEIKASVKSASAPEGDLSAENGSVPSSSPVAPIAE